MNSVDSEKQKEFSEKLEKLGGELSKIQYDFKIQNKTSEKYWVARIEEFKKYHQKVIDYFSQAYLLMDLTNEEQSKPFLLKLSKLKQIGARLTQCLEKVKENPSVMDLKDQQQSKWSVNQREDLIRANQECLDHEKHMNVFFREFYEKNLK